MIPILWPAPPPETVDYIRALIYNPPPPPPPPLPKGTAIIGASLIVVAAVVLVGGLVADLVAANRKLLAEVRGRLLRAELEGLPKEK